MGNATKILFGKAYRFDWSDHFDAVVPASIALYPDAPGGSPADVRITISRTLPDFAAASINPKLHQYAPGEMRTLMGGVHSSWRRTEEGVLEIGVAILPDARLKYAIKKFWSMEFPTKVETFEQVLHELVLVPSVYFSDDTAPIHSAAVAIESGALLLAGTGGVGKSSAIIAFREQEGAQFIADDIAVVSASGMVHGNMAWPKIYGYNCAGNGMASEILSGRGIVDRGHFYVKNRLNPARVRRKIVPDKLYQSVVSEGKELKRIFYLFREDVPKIILDAFPIENAIEMTIAVMESEYSIFHNHLNWEEYNALGRSGTPLLSMVDVRDKWRSIYRLAFGKAEILKVSIPLHIDHAHYQSEILRLVSQKAG